MATTPGPAARHGPAVVGLVPLRTGGKSRLGGTLSEPRRAELVLAMLDDVLAATRGAGLDDVRVLAGDPAAEDAAHARGLRVHRDPTPGGAAAPIGPGDRSLRTAVDAALAVVGDRSIRLVVAADLPRLRAEEVRAAITHAADVAVAPTVGGGTALLRLAAGVTLPTRYGPGSARAHLAEAARSGWTSALLDLPGARHDVDAAEDLAALHGPLDGSVTGRSTAAFLSGPRG